LEEDSVKVNARADLRGGKGAIAPPSWSKKKRGERGRKKERESV